MTETQSSAFFRRILAHRNALGSFLRHCQPVSLLSGLPGNIGDHLIWAGTESLLKAEGVEFTSVAYETLAAGSIEPVDGTLLIPGSGAMTAHWHEWLPRTVIHAAKAFERVVVLPSEYEPNVDVVREALSHPNVFAFARDTQSYGLIKRYGRASLGVDPALFALPQLPCDSPVRSDEDLGHALVALRTDVSSSLREFGLRPFDGNDDISVTSGDLQSFLQAIRTADSVVTDRLHVVVAAVMLGKTIRYVDPFNEKISRYVRFNFREEFNNHIESRDHAWLLSRGYVTKSSP